MPAPAGQGHYIPSRTCGPGLLILDIVFGVSSDTEIEALYKMFGHSADL